MREEVVTTRLDSETVQELRRLARLNERTLSAEVRLAVRMYLDRQERSA